MDPYISVTDFTSPRQVRDLRRILESTHSRRKLGVGVMASYKTINGLPTRWEGKFPMLDALEDIFSEEEGVLNVLHYADYDGHTPLAALPALKASGSRLHAVQLDMPWPDIEDTAALAERTGVEIILQVGTVAMSAKEDNPVAVAETLARYAEAGALHAVLFDRSMGKGLPFDPEVVLPYLRVAEASCPGVLLAVAGGFGPGRLRGLWEVLREFPDISIDAQSKLRPSGDAMDPVDWGLAGAYIRQAGTLLG